MTVVCVPDDHAVELLGPVPDGVEVLAWNGEDTQPDGLERTEFWVPQVEDASDLPAKFAAMPQLQVMQLTSAGIEDVAGPIPDGVTLCDARGVHGSAVAELVAAADPRPATTVAGLPGQPAAGAVAARARRDDLRDKRVLIIGAGDLGEQTARRLRGFDAVPVLVAQLRPRRGARHRRAAAAAARRRHGGADVAADGPAPSGMVDAEFLARMPDGRAC